jgi:hypothetical protein
MTQAMPAVKGPEKAAEAKPGRSNKTALVAITGAVAIAAIGGAVWMQSHKTPEVTVVQTPAPAPEPVAAPEPPPETLTNDGIIDMVKAKLPMEVILSTLRSSPNKFNLSAAEVIRLTKAGVPLNIIEGMRDPKAIPPQKVPPKAVETAKAGAPNSGKAAPGTPATPATQTPQGQSQPAQPQQPTQPAPTPAQTAATPATPEPTQTKAAPAATAHAVLPDGSPFTITLSADIPEDAKPGLALHFVVKNDVKIGNDVVIHKGSAATGEITQARRTFGKMQMRLTSVTGADGKTYKIRALSARSNKSQERQVDTGAKTPSKIEATAGTDYIAYADGELSIGVNH